jgi:very-short-patch-repair endonuclease
VIGGLSAAAMQGAPWIDDDIPIELIWKNTHAPEGLVVRNDTVAADEVDRFGRMSVTNCARTAFDLGRRLPRDDAVARLDALMWAQRFPVDDVWSLAQRYPRARGLKGLRVALPLIDAGAASPKETWLRLLLIDNGYNDLTTQIPVFDRQGLIGVADMGWPELRIAVEYDGDYHRTSRRRYVMDQRKLRRLAALGWIVIRVIAEDDEADILARVERARRVREAEAMQGLTRMTAA